METTCARSCCAHRPNPRIVAVENRDIIVRLSGEDSFLGGGISGKIGITVEMIFGDIEQHGDARPKLFHPFQLKAADFDNSPIPMFRAQPIKGAPRLPPTKVFVPFALSISPINVVVVLLPLVPVIAISGTRKER